jgi:four helix bundle protein
VNIKSLRDLVVWQEGMSLAKETYRLTASFPKHEVYGLASQMRRSAVSIPSNIAEGHARKSTLEYLHFLSIAIGSLAEYETQLMLSIELGFGAYDQAAGLLRLTDTLGKRLRTLIQSLERRPQTRKAPR